MEENQHTYDIRFEQLYQDLFNKNSSNLEEKRKKVKTEFYASISIVVILLFFMFIVFSNSTLV